MLTIQQVFDKYFKDEDFLGFDFSVKCSCGWSGIIKDLLMDFDKALSLMDPEKPICFNEESVLNFLFCPGCLKKAKNTCDSILFRWK